MATAATITTAHGQPSSITPATKLETVVPEDEQDLPTVARCIYVGVGGDVEVVDTEGNTVVHVGVPSGSYIGPFYVARVKAANTTADSMIAYC